MMSNLADFLVYRVRCPERIGIRGTRPAPPALDKAFSVAAVFNFEFWARFHDSTGQDDWIIEPLTTEFWRNKWCGHLPLLAKRYLWNSWLFPLFSFLFSFLKIKFIMRPHTQLKRKVTINFTCMLSNVPM